ncbi:MAG: asparagine synthase [Candidatus Methanoplasma sp.]|jgi:asparagine synthase (glutamine-hydrolysing)|nr:asparagine synthase [Candidatus Methanoplasma sp.]
MTSDLGSLRKALDGAVREAVSGKNAAVAFSGGLDSGIIAAAAKEYAEGTTLYTVGSEGSHDIREAGSSAEEFGMRLICIPITEDDVLKGLKEMILITGTKDPVTLSFEVPLFFVCKNCAEWDVITGQGADELFAGYSKYIGLNENDLKEKRAEDMRKLFEHTLPHEKKVAEHFGKKMHYPYLDEKVIEAVNGLELGAIAPADDPASRKRVLREVSDLAGYPNISAKEKKAAQYGSGTMALIKKICRDRNVTYACLIEMLCREVGR